MQRINSVHVKENKNIRIEQSKAGKDCPQERKPQVDFLSVFVLLEKQFGKCQVNEKKQYAGRQKKAGNFNRRLR